MNSLSKLLLLTGFFALSPFCEAGLQFEKKQYDVTSGIHDMKMTFEFPFVNKSTESVKITKVETSCSCLTARLPEDRTTYSVGESGKILLDIDLGAFGGKVEKDATVITSEGERIPLKLTVKVPEFVKMEPRTLKWIVGEAPATKSIKLIIHKDLNLNLKEVNISKENFDFEPVTIKPGREYEIKVTPKSTAGPEFAMLSIMTDSTEARYKKVLGFLSIVQKPDKK